MNWHDQLESALPPPRDDEPANLRRDIADELADHLQCAMQRELRRTDDDRQARANVLARFGNPQRIARQLWMQSMKGKLMTQRILIATNIILAASTIAVAVFAVSVVRQSREFQAGLVAELRATMGQMLDERAVVLTSQPFGTDSNANAAVPGDVPQESREELHERWAKRLAALSDNWRAAFAAGQELLTLPVEQGFAIVRDNWQHIANVSARQQIIKAFAFSVMQDMHPHMIDVMHVGMRDESPDVQSWAMGYLKWMAFEDFATDFEAYERWRERHAGQDQRQIMTASIANWVQRLRDHDESALAILAENTLLALRDQPFMQDAARQAGLLETLEPIIAAAAAAGSSNEQRDRAEGALARLAEVQADEPYLRHIIMPIIVAQPPSPMFNRAVGALEGQRNAWASAELSQALTDLVLRGSAHDVRDSWIIARTLASYSDPATIPLMIALIAADDTYDTVYGIGYFGLHRLTGVDYDESHDGAWWTQWWQDNRQRYPEPVRSMDIPELQAHASEGSSPADSMLTAGGNQHMRYRLYGTEAAAPDGGYKLLLVVPGGGGSDEFRSFVSSMHSQSLPEGYLLAQLIAPVWDEKQPEQVVWPTQGLKWPTMQFSTEQFIAAVIDDIDEGHDIDKRHIYAMGWSSGGPPVYATAMQPQTRLTGAFVVMSVFHPQQYPSAAHAKGRAFYILHSPQDFIAMRFPEAAVSVLGDAGAKVKLQTYEGGHGWHGDVFGNIRRGVMWLQAQAGE